MSDVIDDDDTDGLAAEYVLGTLDADERTHANLLLDIDDAFRGKVRLWERRLGELHLMVEPVEPAPQILERIKAKMEGVATSSAVAAKLASTETAAAETATPESEPELAMPTSEEKAPENEIEKEAASESDRTAEPAAIPQITALDALEAELREAGLAEPATESPLRPATLLPKHESEVVLGALNQVDEQRSDLAVSDQHHAAEPRAPYIPSKETEALRPALRRWRAVAVLLFMVALALSALMAVWRYAPERLPPELSVHSVLNTPLPPPPAPPKPKAPPESVFDE